MCSWGWGLFSESIAHHSQASGIFGKSEALSTMLIFHRVQHHLPFSWFPILNCPCLFEAWVCELQMSSCRLLNLHGLRRRNSDSWLTQEWLRKAGWIRSPNSDETPFFAEGWLVTSETIFQSDFTNISSLTPPASCERSRGGKIKSRWQRQKLRDWMFLWLSLSPKQVSGRALVRTQFFSHGTWRNWGLGKC